jgi:hypothetical protein
VLHEPWEQIGRRQNDPFRLFRRREQFDENLGELKALEKIARKKGDRMQRHLPMVYGFIQTDLGEGLVADMITDADGSPSMTLKGHLWEHGYTEACKVALEEFWRFLISEKILVRDPDPHNILLQKNGSGNLTAYLVDGFGRSEFFPLVEWFSKLAERKLRKREARMYMRIRKHLKEIETGKPLSGKGMVQR